MLWHGSTPAGNCRGSTSEAAKLRQRCANASADEAHLFSKQKPVVEDRRGEPKKGAGTVLTDRW